tara:strand:- start:779 stop:997 length:219 start_codon:yes stop_codon:yes gene_type:complete
MMWVIVIFMFMPLNSAEDALRVTHLDGKPLEFTDANHCYEHIQENLNDLKALASKHYGDTAIKQIDCFRKVS